ncbi:MAG TPA: ABC transporter ATP-binding protein, partial [Candidatus Agrococcus pullicola]|nr:ABC transporter ATP-binding protein [Candidatus Agrococcus pullicola]
MTNLDVDITLSRGAFELAARFDVAAGEVLGIVGRNGVGKSSLLGAIAGSIPIDSGSIRISDRELVSQRDGRGSSVPRWRRRVGHLDQRSRLFPHLSARENIAFGPRSQGMRKPDARSLADEWLERVGLEGRGPARAEQLSGGQQQRVALARVLACSPDVVLLDEPFAALDVASVGGIRDLVRTQLRRSGVPVALVTHDSADLLSLADRVIVLEAADEGRPAGIHQRGTVAEVLRTPTTRFAADIAGRVLLSGTVSERGSILLPDAPLRELPIAEPDLFRGTQAHVSFDPADVRVTAPVGAEHESSSTAGTWVGTVAGIQATRNGLRITTREWDGFAAEVPLSEALDLELREGTSARFELPP